MSFPAIHLVDPLDLTAPQGVVQVEVQHRPTGMVLYLHCEGRTVTRLCRIPALEIILDGQRLALAPCSSDA
jgi:hypothetical protein